jgi:hypothetical protein
MKLSQAVKRLSTMVKLRDTYVIFPVIWAICNNSIKYVWDLDEQSFDHILNGDDRYYIRFTENEIYNFGKHVYVLN